jgi:hypothetical protein
VQRLAVSLAGFRRGGCDCGVALLKVFDHVQAAIRRTLTVPLVYVRDGSAYVVCAAYSGSEMYPRSRAIGPNPTSLFRSRCSTHGITDHGPRRTSSLVRTGQVRSTAT